MIEVKNKWAGKTIFKLDVETLRGADLQGANLDFSSGIPFCCKGTKIKGDRRLFAQMVYHLTRQDWQELTKRESDWLKAMPTEILNSFLRYRNDLEEM